MTFRSDSHRYLYKEEQVELVLDRFVEDAKEGLFCEITVSTGLAPKAGLLHHGRLNLSATRSKDMLAKALQRRTVPGFLDNVDFAAVLEQVTYRSLARWRDGEPAVDLWDVDTSQRARWLLEPYLEDSGVTVIFGTGGSTKSIFATGVAVSLITGRPLVGKQVRGTVDSVLYADWEADKETHATRLRAIATGYGLDELRGIIYRRQVASLAEAAPTLRRDIAVHHVGMVIVDSSGAARGGDPSSAESTIKMFNALRSFDVPVLLIDHIAKNATDKTTPFGSVYTVNLARSIWRIDRVQEEASPVVDIALTHLKVNNGPLMPRQAYQVAFDVDDDDLLRLVTWQPSDPRSVQEFLESMSVRDRISAVLQQGRSTMTVEEIHSEVTTETHKVSAATVRTVLNRFHNKLFVSFGGSGPKQAQKWGLISPLSESI